MKSLDVNLSVIIPTYNRRNILKRCLDNFYPQSFPLEKFEVIVIDDGSNDGTKEMVEQFQISYPNIIYVYQENQGPGGARNNAVNYSNSQNLVFIDSDCLVKNDLIEKMDKYFNEYPDIYAFGGRTVPIFHEGLFKSISPFFIKNVPYFNSKELVVFDKLRPLSRLCTDCCGIRKEIFLEVEGFDQRFIYAGEDPDLWFKVLSKGYTITYVNDIVAYHYERPELVNILKKFFKFGFADTVNYKDHFSNWFTFIPPHFLKLPPFYIEKFPITVSIQINKFLILTTILFVCIFKPLLGCIILLLTILQQARRMERVSLLFKVMMYEYLRDGAFVLGKIVGSFKNKTIHI